jgi:four helix bundle protein
MGARRFEELEAWRISDNLKREVYALLASGSVRRDFNFCQQLREAAASAPRNIAEGFGRFRPAPFAQFMEVAVGSMMETQALLNDGVDRGHFTTEQIAIALDLAGQSLRLSTKLLLYLKRCRDSDRGPRARVRKRT